MNNSWPTGVNKIVEAGLNGVFLNSGDSCTHRAAGHDDEAGCGRDGCVTHPPPWFQRRPHRPVDDRRPHESLTKHRYV